MTAETTDLYDKFVALLKQLDLALGGERQKNTNLIKPVLFPESVGFLRSGHGGRIFALSIQHSREILQALPAQYLMREQRYLLCRHRRKVLLDLMHHRVLGGVPLIEPGIANLCWEQTVYKDCVHGEPMQREVDERPLRLPHHHLLRIGDQPHTGDPRILHHLTHSLELVEEVPNVA